MEKFELGNTGLDPIIVTPNEANIARFGHLNKMIEDYQTFTTIISAEQAATLSSVPVQLNVPEGMYTLAGGYIYYSADATETLELGSEQIIIINSTLIISKNAGTTINPASIQMLAPYFNSDSRVTSGKVFFSTDVDAEIAPNGPVEITVYLTKLNLTIK
jgi:hypothetical protein